MYQVFMFGLLATVVGVMVTKYSLEGMLWILGRVKKEK